MSFLSFRVSFSISMIMGERVSHLLTSLRCFSFYTGTLRCCKRFLARSCEGARGTYPTLLNKMYAYHFRSHCDLKEFIPFIPFPSNFKGLLLGVKSPPELALHERRPNQVPPNSLALTNGIWAINRQLMAEKNANFCGAKIASSVALI